MRSDVLRCSGLRIGGLLLVFALICGCAALPKGDLSESTPDGMVQDEVAFGDVTVRTYRHSLDDLRVGEPLASFEVLRKGKKLFEAEGWAFYISGRKFESQNLVVGFQPGDDITGNKIPNVVIYEWTGGAHCCAIAWVLEIGRECRVLARIEGRHSAPIFQDLDGDSIPEVIVRDWTFEYWPASFATSPAPKVILRWSNGEYVVDKKLTRTPVPAEQELVTKAETIRSSEGWECIYPPCIPYEVFHTALDLMYGGHEELGWKFIEMAWSPKFPLDTRLLEELRGLLERSDYWRALKQ